MNELIDKLSSYNIFNHLFPGVLFAVIVTKISSIDLLIDDIIVGVFLYYFYGVVISRIGSLILEPTLKAVGIIVYTSYNEFLEASQEDPKIEILSETNNSYRALASLFFCVLLLIIFDQITMLFSFQSSITPFFGIALLLILFVVSYRKQTNFISARITNALAHKKQNDKNRREVNQ